jgi:hypothetical protein
MKRKESRPASANTSAAQKLLKIDQKYQAAVDRLVATARWPRDKDEEALVQSWWDRYALADDPSELIVMGMRISSDRWSDADLIDWEGISKGKITDAKRIQHAREMILRDANGEDWCAFEAAKIESSDGETAFAIIQVRSGGQPFFALAAC